MATDSIVAQAGEPRWQRSDSFIKAQTIAMSFGTQSPTHPPTRPNHTMR